MLRRFSKKIPLGPRIHIASEGQATEPDYISAVRIECRIAKEQVVLLPHQCTDPLSLVKQMIDHKATKAFARGTDQAWVIFDVDEHRQKDRKAFSSAVTLASRNEIRLAFSNPSVELWLWLHFKMQTANIHRKDVRQSVQMHLKNYDKALDDRHLKILLSKRRTANRNACELAVRNSRHPYSQDPFRNPSTTLHLLIISIEHLAPHFGP